MEDEGVCGVGIVATIDLAGDDNAHGRLALFHGANLHRRRVRTKEQWRWSTFRKVEVEGVHVIADGVELGDVERLKIIVRRFDFGAFDDGEAAGEEKVFGLLEDLAEQVMRADGTVDAGEREVDVLTGQCRLVGTRFDGEAARFYL